MVVRALPLLLSMGVLGCGSGGARSSAETTTSPGGTDTTAAAPSEPHDGGNAQSPAAGPPTSAASSSATGSDNLGSLPPAETGGAANTPARPPTEAAAGGPAAGGPAASDPGAGGSGTLPTGDGGTTGGASSGGAGGAVSSNPPAPGMCSVHITCDTELNEDDKVLCALEVRDSAGALFYGGHAGVEYRGRSSLNFPKLNYSVELRTSADEESPANLLGMGSDADWILDGAWADRSLMRNSLAYDLFRDMGHYASEGRYCNVWLNERAQGVYRLGERLKRDDDRVLLPADDGAGASFLVKQDIEGLIDFGLLPENPWQLIYPKQANATEAQLTGVQVWFEGLQAALTVGDPDLASYLDASVTRDWLLLQELSKNIDAYFLSIHLSRAPNSPAQLIPWDFDLSFGQPTVSERGQQAADRPNNETPEGWIWNRTAFVELLSDSDSLRASLGPRWRELREGVLSEAALMTRLDAYQAELDDESIAANFELWPLEEVEFDEIYEPYSFYDVASYEEEVEHMRAWILQRMTWIDGNIDSYPNLL
jgi:CotH kinase protein